MSAPSSVANRFNNDRVIAWMLATFSLTTSALAQASPDTESPAYSMPVSEARTGIPASLSYLMRLDFTSTNAYYTGDQNLYYFLHWEEFVPHNLVRRAGPVKKLIAAPSGRIGRGTAESSLGEMTLDELIAAPRSRMQGLVVVHREKSFTSAIPA